jgi:ABC-type dipeptide/oligopeptide/nickel transport system permease component
MCNPVGSRGETRALKRFRAERPLLLYVAKRLLFMPVGIFVVVSLAFLIVNVVPSDPAREISGGLAKPQELQEIRHSLGIDRPLPDRYLHYLGQLAHANLGTSYFAQRPVSSEIRQFLPNTVELIVMALLVATAIGLVVGGASAYFRGRWPDRLGSGWFTVTQSIPDFLLGLIFIYFLFFTLRWAPPPVGRLGLLDTPPHRVTGGLIVDSVIGRDWSTLRSAFSHSVLPVLTLGLYYSAYLGKTARAALTRAFNSNQVEFGRACGLSERKVIGYAFREARTPILTYGGILFAGLVGGAAIVETIFAWGGIGQWAIASIIDLDIPAIQGFILIAGLITLVVFLVVDVLVVVLDPRVSYD